MTSSTIAKTGNSRVFLLEGRARIDHKPTYQSCIKSGAVEQGFGDIEKVECPDPSNYGKYIETATIKGAVERATVTLTGRYALDVKSELLRLAAKGCAVDVQVHLGSCTDPSVFETFKKAVVLENAYLTNFSTEDLGSLGSDEEAKVDESTDVSAKAMYEIVPISFSEKAADVVTNELVDVTICDTIQCGDCGEQTTGCSKVYAVSKAAGGSAGTPPDVVFSLDKGVTWYAHDIDSLPTANDAAAIACLGNYLVVVATNATYPMHYVLKANVTAYVDPVWTNITTGFVAAGTPRAIWSSGTRAYIVGSAGYIYYTEDPTAGVTVLDAGVATAANLTAVDGLDDTFAVAVGVNGSVVKIENGVCTRVQPLNIPLLGYQFSCVLVKSKNEWILGTSGGRLLYTLDGGSTFYEKAFSGYGSGAVWDVTQASDSVLYLSHATATPKGRILRSYNGGYSWTILPDTTGSMPASDRFTALAACESDVNFVVGVGLADLTSDGIVVVGT